MGYRYVLSRFKVFDIGNVFESHSGCPAIWPDPQVFASSVLSVHITSQSEGKGPFVQEHSSSSAVAGKSQYFLVAKGEADTEKM